MNRFTARHWVDALSRWERVAISGLVAHDPEAGTSEVRAVLKQHQPVGVADATTWLLLQEWGVEATIDPGGAADGRPFDLWSDAVVPASGWAPPRPAVDAGIVDAVPRRQLAQGRVAAGPGVGTVELAFAVDGALAREFPVALESCLAHTTLPVRCHVMLRGVDAASLREWQTLFAGRAQLVAHDMSGLHVTGNPTLIAHTTESTLDRLLLPWLLPDVPRVIYLDIDLVVMGDLAPLWRLDLAGAPLAAKPSTSPGTRWGLQMLYKAVAALPADAARAVRLWLHRSGSMTFRAFNAGVLLMDLGRMRRDAATPLLLSLVEHAGMNDQDALNAYARGGYRQLGLEWNAAPRQDPTEGAKIIHFVGPVKPWHELYVSRKHEFERIRQQLQQRRTSAPLA